MIFVLFGLITRAGFCCVGAGTFMLYRVVLLIMNESEV
jgi:hypothetical protein